MMKVTIIIAVYILIGYIIAVAEHFSSISKQFREEQTDMKDLEFTMRMMFINIVWSWIIFTPLNILLHINPSRFGPPYMKFARWSGYITGYIYGMCVSGFYIVKHQLKR